MNGAPQSIWIPNRCNWPLEGGDRIRRHAQRLWYLATSTYQRQRQRRALAGLDAHLLRDIGLTGEQARLESAKPFWRE